MPTTARRSTSWPTPGLTGVALFVLGIVDLTLPVGSPAVWRPCIAMLFARRPGSGAPGRWEAASASLLPASRAGV
eukprot:15152590-Alexandrium_andersonii.AAC.1